MHVWTEAPLAEIWRQLRYLRSPANVKRVLTRTERGEKTGPKTPALDDRAYEISACIRQADEYFAAAETVGLATEPLLQYYGAQALAKAAILADREDTQLQDIKYHGLTTRPSSDELRGYVEDPEAWTIEGEFGVTKEDGVFPRLCDVVGDPIQVNEPLIFQDVVGRIPDLMPLYSRHYGVKLPMIKLCREPQPNAEGRLLVVTDCRLPHAEIKERLPVLSSGFEETEESAQTAFLSVDVRSELPHWLALTRHTVNRSTFLVARHPAGIAASTTTLYVSLYILGNLVRYKPGFWMQEMEGVRSGSVAIVEALLNVAKRRFTHDMLDLIWGERFTFRTPAYWT